MNYSNTLEFMIKDGEGYRNTYGTFGVSDLSDIIKFEVNELHNTDIFDFMRNNYKAYSVNPLYDKNNKIEYTLYFISRLFNTSIDNLRGVWLTTYQNVLDKYCYDGLDSGFNEVIKVNIHEKKMIPISDLGDDGALFAYVENTNKENETKMKTLIYPVINLCKNNNYFIKGSDSVVYNKIKYPIGIGYDIEKKCLKFVILKPEALHEYKNDKDSYHPLSINPNNYWDGAVGLVEFKIVNIYDDIYKENRDFFTDDIKTIRDYYGLNFDRKFTNDHVYILQDNYYVALSEFGDETDKILGIFIKKVCKNLAYYLRLIDEVYKPIKQLQASVYDLKSHKYLSDVFIALRHGYEKDPETMTDDEFHKVDKALEKKFTDMGFVSINDYTGFDGSHGFVFINPTSNKELIHFYKMLYFEDRSKSIGHKF